MKQILQALAEWRKRFFLTPSEANTLVNEALVAQCEPTRDALHKARECELKALLLWQGMQSLSVDVNARRQSIEIRMVLNRASLALLDVTDAARLLAQRTEALYLKRLEQIAAEARHRSAHK